MSYEAAEEGKGGLHNVLPSLPGNWDQYLATVASYVNYGVESLMASESSGGGAHLEQAADITGEAEDPFPGDSCHMDWREAEDDDSDGIDGKKMEEC